MQSVSRLVQQFLPDHYQLYLHLDREERRFYGTTTIYGTALTKTTTITMHAKKLTIESVTINGKKAQFTLGSHDELAITHPEISEGRQIIVIAYSGTITDTMHGLYPCYYTHDDRKQELLATQFESHHAREVFPCIDEPEAKATFDVTLVTEPDVTVLGNMPIKRQTIEDERLVTTFLTTPRMSTYLLAWVTGKLHRKTALTTRGIEVNVWATPAQPVQSLEFALDMAVRTIEFLDEYFETPYPLPKADHVALPDFSAGAMENWGLITYREFALLADPTITSVSHKRYIAMVIAHELSHQWFGNLVTMRWWDNLWLNESFATFMATLVLNHLHPEWEEWLQFAISETVTALHRDSLEGVQSVQVTVEQPDQINSLFDPAIVYAKGARLLRMLQHYIGDEAFQAGLKDYFATHAYSNTDDTDLWQAFSKARGYDITSLMHAWISQPGYPVVSVTQKASQLHLTQQRFFIGPHKDSTPSSVWPIPLGASDSDLPPLFTKRHMTVPSPPQLSRFNVGDSSHFITHYDARMLGVLTRQLQKNALSPLDRLQLLHEQTLLARGGMVSSATLLPLLNAFTHESSEPVWYIIGLAINELKIFVETNNEAERHLRALVCHLTHDQYSRLGWHSRKHETETDVKLRAIIIGLTLYGEEPTAIATAIELYNTIPLEKLDPELRPLIIGAAVRHTNQSDITTSLIDLYQTTPSASLRDDIASGLTSTRDTAVIRHLLTLLTDSSVIRRQDLKRWFGRLIQNRFARELTWQWLQDNWPWIQATFGSDKSYDDYPRYVANGLMTRAQLQEYEAFFGPLQHEPALARTIRLGIGEIAGRVELLERDSGQVHKALMQLSA